MTMEKYGVQKEIQHEALRREEADLMVQMQMLMSDATKTAADKTELETRLCAVRSKITELDLGQQ